MRLLLITAGSRGDVEPFLALARVAAAAGHEVQVAAPDDAGATAHGVDVVSLGVGFTTLIEEHGVSVAAALRTYRTTVKPLMRGVIVGAARAALAFRPDVVVAHPKILSAPLIARALQIPHVLVEMVPAVTPTRAFPAAGTITTGFAPINRLTYRAATGAAWMFQDALDDAARLLGTARSRPMPPPAATLLPISPTLLERPEDWPAHVHLTGPWTHPDDGARLEPDLAAFVDGGPFVYAGFGSMALGDATARGRALVDAARVRGDRLLVATGLGGIDIAPELRGEDVFVVRSVPHHLVLPHADAAVHHGGIGTVQAATRAGTVSIIVPFIADQPFWGAMLHRRGLTPSAIPQRRLTRTRLRGALDEAPMHSRQVAAAAEQMRDEDGTASALGIVASL